MAEYGVILAVITVGIVVALTALSGGIETAIDAVVAALNINIFAHHADRVKLAAIVATATHCVSAIPYVCAAPPGIKTYLDLPLIAGRAAPRAPHPALASATTYVTRYAINSWGVLYLQEERGFSLPMAGTLLIRKSGRVSDRMIGERIARRSATQPRHQQGKQRGRDGRGMLPAQFRTPGRERGDPAQPRCTTPES
mgnify:CR=1 FL=1